MDNSDYSPEHFRISIFISSIALSQASQTLPPGYSSFLNAKYAAMGIDYSEVTGDGRINLVDGSLEEDVTPPTEDDDVIPPTGDIAVVLLGISTILSMGAVSVLKKRG